MAKVYAGTSGWSYPSWKPRFYPAKLASAKFLSYYSTRLNSVEVNYTFRRFPAESLLSRWISATPEEFKFAIKAHQMITHIKRLRETGEWVARFIDSVKLLHEANRLGPILFQLPPYLKCDLDLLANFLEEIPSSVRAALEFRHESWFCEEVFAALRRRNVALCEAESDKLKSPTAETADFSYLRLRKENYSTKAREAIAKRTKRLVGRGDVFVYFKHEDTPEGALYAEALLGMFDVAP
ncbi:MAG TPA: DUF72 domain-containing protein [Candidatus Acidoferrales bacterium]|nr:DUF72 domain-containing protein [Candidatus Acidoferrales bacterium]